jgi:hypothetical protein
MARMGALKMHLIDNLEGDYLKHLDVDGRIILKWVLRGYKGKEQIHFDQN